MATSSAVEIKIGVDAGTVKTNLDRVQSEFRTASAGIVKALESIQGFSHLKRQSEETAKAYGETQKKVVDLAKAVKSGVGGAALAKDFERAKAEAARLKEELGRQHQQLQQVRTSMASAGVSTANLAGQQTALRAQLEATRLKYQEFAKVAQARDALGLTPHAEIAAEIDKARNAYAALAASGKLSMAELAQAKVVLRGRIDELTRRTTGWRDALVGVKTGMVEVAAAAAPTVLAISQAIKFESSMAGVKKVVEATPAEFAALRAELLAMTRQLPLTANELAQVAQSGGQLGIASQDISAFVNVTAKMATAFDMTAQEAGDSIGKIKNVYQLAVGEVEGLGDTINRLGNTSAAREKDIVEVMLRVGGTANQFGLARESTAALSAAFLSLGKAPEVAATSINSMLNRMQTATMQSSEFQTALGKIGMSAEEMAAQVASNPQRALDTLLETLSKLSGQQRAEVLTGLFGREFQDDIGVLVGSLGTYRDAMGQVADKASYAGSMNKEFEERTKTTENQLQLLNNAVVEAAINLGTTFLPAVRAILAPIITVIRVMADMAAAAPNLTAALVAIGTGGLVFGQVAKLASIAKLAMLAMAKDSVAALGSVPGVIGQISWAMTALTVGWQIGSWLNQFDVVKKAGVTLAHTLTMGWLKVREAWEWMTGGDTGQIQREMENARKTYALMIAEIDAKSKQSSTTQVQEQKKVTESAQQSAAAQQRATGDALKEMQKQYKAYADQVKSLQEEITDRQQSLTAELREMNREGMTEIEAWKDRKKEAAEYYAAAQLAAKQGKEALKAGDQAAAALKFDEAKRLADEAKSAYKALNAEVKDGDQVLVSSRDALKASMAGMQQAGQVAIDVLTQQRDAAAGAMDNLISKAGFADLSQGMDQASQAWMNNWKSMQAASTEAVAAVEERILKLVTPERTVWVNVKERSAATEASAPAAPGVAGYRWGGIIQALAAGGGVRNILGGGHLPGWGGGDTEPLMGEPGEVMIRKESVRAAGLPAALAFNAGRFDVVMAELSKRLKSRIGYRLGGLLGAMPQLPVQHLASGGAVHAASAVPAPSKVVELRFAGGQVQGDERSVEMLLQHLETAGLSA
jgi:TP901 family phage tail tape measure protein